MTELKHKRGEAFKAALAKKTLILDGSTGVEFQRMKLTEAQARGRRFLTHTHPLVANFDILALSRPDLVEKVHRNYLEAGADIIETDTFNSTRLSQKKYGVENLAREINLAAARIAAKTAAEYTRRDPGKPRFTAGSMGPTAFSASLPVDMEDTAKRAVDFETLAEDYAEQAEGLIEGGTDFLLIETAYDLLNAKAAAEGALRAMEKLDTEIPLAFSFTISDASGRILSGHSPEAILAAIAPYSPATLGFNCSAGPDRLAGFTRELAMRSPFPVIFYPNAGMPDRMGHYDIDAAQFAGSLLPLAESGMLNIAGGCCGTGPEHIAALAQEVEKSGRRHDCPADTALPWLAGMEAFYDDRRFINVGERCNVCGSRKFLRLINEKKYDEALAIARRQVEDGAMILDINMDDGMLDAKAEMSNFLRVLGSDPLTAGVPWMIDSSDFGAIEEALRNIPGRAVVNSISLKHGEEEFLRQAHIIRRYGAAVVVMLFDEKGQADTLARKKEIAARAIGLLTREAGFTPRDIVVDPMVLSIATGMPEHDRYALDFIEATRWISETFPGVKTSGGVSNLSFSFRGNNKLRQSMHAVFLYHAIKAGLSMAIMDPGTKVTYSDIDPDLLERIEDAILCRRPDAGVRLAEAAEKMVNEKTGPSPETEHAPEETLPVDRRLVVALVKGDDSRLSSDIPEAVDFTGNANTVVEDILMEGMEEVGRLFESGKMFLPQVVKSARTMHRAVDLLLPYLEGSTSAGKKKGTFVVATVKGDVHDIGKNIAAVVLRCNNYDVIDLGVQVDARAITEAAKEHKPDFIGLSGLISPSLEEMAKTLAALREEGVTVPVFVGGAATSELHTALRLAPAYGDGLVVRVSDASQNPLVAGKLARDFESTAAGIKRQQTELAEAYEKKSERPVKSDDVRRPETDWDNEELPAPAFTGIRTLEEIPIETIEPYINWTFFYNCWKVLPDSQEAAGLLADAEKLFARLKEKGATMRAQAAFYEAHSEGDAIIADGRKIPTPRQTPAEGRDVCLALSDFIAPEGYCDHIGCFVVTTGAALREELRTLQASADQYESLLLQSLCDRLAEATSEWLHREVRVKLWGYAPDEEPDMAKIRRMDYRGIRPAVGYPSLPDQMLMHTLMDMLDPGALDIGVTENGALSPSATVAGFYFASPRAKYFSVLSR